MSSSGPSFCRVSLMDCIPFLLMHLLLLCLGLIHLLSLLNKLFLLLLQYLLLLSLLVMLSPLLLHEHLKQGLCQSLRCLCSLQTILLTFITMHISSTWCLQMCGNIPTDNVQSLAQITLLPPAVA